MDGRRIGVASGMALLLGAAMGGCMVSGPSEPDSEPLRPEPCASQEAGHPDTESTTAESTTAEPTSAEPASVKLAYRGEELADGSVRMTVGDVDAAPEDPDAVRVFDHRAPASFMECDRVRIVEVSGWWCTTTVEPIDVEGEIVLGDTAPRARIGGDGFVTDCHGERPGRLRQVYQLERDSWSGWRDYGTVQRTSWTEAGRQLSGEVWEPCPQGRVGTYDYQLSVSIEIDGVEVGRSLATSAAIRADCGTGVS